VDVGCTGSTVIVIVRVKLGEGLGLWLWKMARENIEDRPKRKSNACVKGQSERCCDLNRDSGHWHLKTKVRSLYPS
jgi:hypothetical protein